MPFQNIQRHAWRPIGTRNVPITLQRPTNVIDSMGGRFQTWSPYGSEHACVVTQADFKGEQNSVIVYEIEFPYRNDVTVGDRVVTGDLTLKIVLVDNPEQRNRSLVLHCAEVVLND